MYDKLYIKIAYWYYTLGLTQDEIAKRLSFTRQKVNHIINSLVDLGVVTINIHGYESENMENESYLEEAFGLKRAIIASDYGESETALYKVTNVAAQYLESTIQQGDVIGLSWGQTLSNVIASMTYQKRSNCRVVQLIGAQNIEKTALKSDEIVRELANKLDCPSYMLHAPVVVDYEETKEMLMKEKTVRASFDCMRKCNIGVFGIGELSEKSTMCKRGYIQKEDMERMRAEGFTSDIGMNPIRLDGSFDHCHLEKRILNAGMDIIGQIDNVIAVASGIEKAEAILSVLRTKCVDTLIVDETTAKKIIQEKRRSL
ncbi:MAG: sugar-binding transcriptional regulator [Lachnospiraceae bacterium]